MNCGIKTEINLSFLPQGAPTSKISSRCIPKGARLGRIFQFTLSRRLSSAGTGGSAVKGLCVSAFLPSVALPFIAACSRALLYGAFYGAGYQTVILGPLLSLKMERRFKLKLSASGMLDRLRSDVLIFDNSVAQNLSVTSFENTFLILSNCRPFS